MTAFSWDSAVTKKRIFIPLQISRFKLSVKDSVIFVFIFSSFLFSAECYPYACLTERACIKAVPNVLQPKELR